MASLNIFLRLFLLIFFLIFSPSVLHAEDIVNGKYIGWKQSPNLSNDESETWYHENDLEIKDNKLSIESSPVSVKNGIIAYSASTGSFYLYKGNIFKKNNKKFVKLKIHSCDYCPVPIDGNFPENEYEIIIVDKLSFKINNVLYVFIKP